MNFTKDITLETQTQPKQSAALTAFTVILQIAGLAALCLAVFQWAVIIGVTGSDFLTLYNNEPDYALLEAFLALSLPFLGLSLWLGRTWALIVWGAILAVLLVTHLARTPLEGTLAHLTVILTLGLGFLSAFHLIIWSAGRKREQDDHSEMHDKA